jgi:ribosomal protein S18 acetylase RimI-like enzyme
MASAVESRLVGRADREAVLRFLSRDAVANLFLLDLANHLGKAPSPGEARAEIAAAWKGSEIVGVAGLYPTLILDVRADEEAIASFGPYLERIKVGLVKSSLPAANVLWDQILARRPRNVIVDRIETGYALNSRDWKPVEPAAGESAQRATKSDLDALVVAARESLREENRPDPFVGDVEGFRRWVRGRVVRARVVESEGRITMVGYADVQRAEGWLLQGIYTWPDCRQRGLASFGVSELCREAFEAGADHVQLAVVEGNEAAQRLYEGLGFKPFAKLRTILFT